MVFPMSFRSWAALALLLAAIAAERCGYYSFRSTFGLYAIRGFDGEGMHMNPRLLFRIASFLHYVAPFAGGAMALVVRPRLGAAIGAGVAALGAFALLAKAPPLLAVAVFAIGSGIARPNLFIAAVEILADDEGAASGGFAPSPRRFSAVAAFMVVAMATANVAAFIASSITSLAVHSESTTPSFGIGGALEVLAALLAGGAFFFGTARANELAQAAHAPYRAPNAPPPPPAPAPRNSDVVFGPLVLIGTAFALLHLGEEHSQPNAYELGLAPASWVYSVSAVVTLLVAVPTAVLYIVSATQRSMLPLTKILGAGLVMWAAGMLLAVFISWKASGVFAWALSLAISAVGDGLATPIALAYAALVWRGPKAVMVFAGWLSLTMLPTVMFGEGLEERYALARIVLTIPGALAGIALGIHVLRKADQMHRQLDASSYSNATS